MTDEEIREQLQFIDDSDYDVESEEAKMLEYVLYDAPTLPLIPKHRKIALEMIEKYPI